MLHLIIGIVGAILALQLLIAAPFLLLAAPFLLLFGIRRMLSSRDPEVIRQAEIIEAIERRGSYCPPKRPTAAGERCLS